MKDSLRERLIAAGFDPSAKSFFSWLGVTYYLSAEAIDTMLSALSSICADGSTLVLDYPDENFFDAPEKRVQNTIMMAKAGGEPMQSAFFYSELETLLQKHGFLIYELLTPDDIQSCCHAVGSGDGSVLPNRQFDYTEYELADHYASDCSGILACCNRCNSAQLRKS